MDDIYGPAGIGTAPTLSTNATSTMPGGGASTATAPRAGAPAAWPPASGDSPGSVAPGGGGSPGSVGSVLVELDAAIAALQQVLGGDGDGSGVGRPG